MKPNPKLDVLRSQLAEQLNSFQRKRGQNKKKAFLVYLGATAISAVVTVLLGLQGIPDDKVVYIRNIALILSATVTLLTGFDTFFNHRALWVRYTQTATLLLGLQAKLDYLSADEGREIPESEVDQLFEEMQRVLTETNRWWQNQRAEEPDGPKPPNPPMHPTGTASG
ncbi:MAG: hypothetical protein CVU59_00205 [Deltaproteobacteria bacterium HGW-Deltaproteobacteria-17]|nr:MAG: hypothetical protein CVU59_00205 [Deltaproteobacteria bacterium HGW-Deltaproteobacteria-17]